MIQSQDLKQLCRLGVQLAIQVKDVRRALDGPQVPVDLQGPQLRRAQVAQGSGLGIGLPVQDLADDRVLLARIASLAPGLGFGGQDLV